MTYAKTQTFALTEFLKQGQILVSISLICGCTNQDHHRKQEAHSVVSVGEFNAGNFTEASKGC